MLCLRQKSSAKCRLSERIYFFTHLRIRVPRSDLMRLDPRDAVRFSALSSPDEILAGAANPYHATRPRRVSAAGLRPLQAKLSRNSNQIARGGIRQFESYMPSHAVRLRRVTYGSRSKPAQYRQVSQICWCLVVSPAKNLGIGSAPFRCSAPRAACFCVRAKPGSLSCRARRWRA